MRRGLTEATRIGAAFGSPRFVWVVHIEQFERIKRYRAEVSICTANQTRIEEARVPQVPDGKVGTEPIDPRTVTGQDVHIALFGRYILLALMKAFVLAAAFFVACPAFAQSLEFSVLRGDCAGGPGDLAQLQQIQSAWLSDGSLEIASWDSETQEYSVVDSSGAMDLSQEGVIRLIYQSKFTPTPPNAPVVFCEDFVRLKFLIRGLERADYEVTVEKSRLLLRSSVEG